MVTKICTALNVSDELPCPDLATSLNGLFCHFHSNQCQGLYKGYKRRNARLDALKPPKYFDSSLVPLANQTFSDVESETTLRELHDYLLVKHTLLTRVIAARKLHHSRFFSVNFDYGHQHYIDNLQNQRHITLRAMESLEKRIGEVLFLQQEWFLWARELQDEEEKSRDNEKKKMKKEAFMFKRYSSNLEARAKESKRKEDLKHQEEFLEEAYHEQMSLKEDEDVDWDPIEDVVENERATYIEIVNLLLMLKDDIPGSDAQPPEKMAVPKSTAKKGKPQKQTIRESGIRPGLETKSQMRKRLRDGTLYPQGASLLVRGTPKNPIELADRTPSVPDDEIDALLEAVSEIKHLLFCRLLLSHASLLSAAIRADSIEELLSNEDVKDTDLRDLCLKMENPEPQEVRDACADLLRGKDEDEDLGRHLATPNAPDTDKDKRQTQGFIRPDGRRDLTSWMPKSTKEAQKQDSSRRKHFNKTLGPTEVPDIDFGVVDDEAEYGGQRIRVKICGRYIYNYPSEKAMSRGGWLHFCIIAKDSDLSDAIKLCRRWDEFFELSVLALYQYFPAANWVSWAADREQSQLVTLGFLPYGDMRLASQMTTTRNRQTRRNFGVVEARSFIAGSIKRNDQASRRFIKYLSMQTSRVLVLVRDATDGRILIQPPQEQRWLLRRGLGRAASLEHQEWVVEKQVGGVFFEELEKSRKWNVGFSEHFDIIVWDREAGLSFSHVYSTVSEMLFKAHRCRKAADIYDVAAPILRSLTRDENSHRSRGIKPGEKSIYDEIHDEGTRFTISGPKTKSTQNIPRYLFYDEADALEDKVLFPEERPGGDDYIAVGESTNELEQLERRRQLHPLRFALDLDTDEELSDIEEDEEDIAYEASEVESSDEDNGRGCDVGVDPMPPEKSSLVNTDEEVVNGQALSLTPSKSPVATFCNELNIPPEDNFRVSICRELAIPDGKYTTAMTIGEKVAFKILYAQYKSSSSAGTVPEMKKIYERSLARESSKYFKEAWHKADLEPGSRHNYIESSLLVDTARKFDQTRSSVAYLIPLAFLRLQPLEHRHIIPDMRQAFTMISLFFPYAADFLSSARGKVFEDHTILDQKARATQPPDRRSHQSNSAMPQTLWKEWDAIKRSNEDYPTEWNKALRPMLARLYREGIIRNSYNSAVQGQVMAAREPGRDLDLYCDFRTTIEGTEMVASDFEEPPTTDKLLARARQFAATRPKACFAFLRTWSSPHFYPLLIGFDKRWELAFADGLGRTWEWKFVPKDMPFSEWSIHRQLKQRMYRRFWGDNVVIKRDSLLVMAKDEDELLKLASAATYAVQTFDTWRLEIDLWKSFVNVDLRFLEELDERWIH